MIPAQWLVFKEEQHEEGKN